MNCQKYACDPNDFGTYGDFKGLWFICDNMICDLLCLNKIKVLPWECCGIMSGKRVDPLGNKLVILDSIKEITQAGDLAVDKIQNHYETTGNLHIPSEYQ